MKVLFVMLHAGFVRYYDSVIRTLSARGNRVHIAYEVERDKLGEQQALQRLMTECTNVTSGPVPHRVENVRHILQRSDASAARSGHFGRSVPTAADDHGRVLGRGGKLPEAFDGTWEGAATSIRLMQDYLRYFDPIFDESPRLRARAEKRVPELLRPVVAVPARRGRLARQAMGASLRAFERVIPTSATVDRYLGRQEPDVLVVTPLVDFGSQQVDYIKSARKLGIPSIHAVASWDNLTSKGLSRVHADRVMVWNDRQREEAVSLHGVPEECVVVTGAQTFDEWFTCRPSRAREDFCRAVGLTSPERYLLYLGSSSFIAPHEVDFVERWIDTVRTASDPAVSACGILVRPHPANARQFRALDLQRWNGVAIWPPIGSEPGDTDFKRDYFDSLFHSAAVVGVNTSALIEAAIVDRIICTVRDPQFVHAQIGAVHFRHLASADGPLVVADDLDAHTRQLSRILSSKSSADTTPFVESFVRPRGTDKAVTPFVTQTVEQLAATRPSPRAESVFADGLRFALYPFAALVRTLASGRTVTSIGIRIVVHATVVVLAMGYRTAEGLGVVATACGRGGKEARRWVYRTRKHIRRELGYTRKRVVRARKRLRKAGIAAGVTTRHWLRRLGRSMTSRVSS